MKHWRRVLLGVLAAAAVVMVGMVLVGIARRDRPKAVCAALVAPVSPPARGFRFDNGITSEEANWDTVLTDGVRYALPADRQVLAREARTDHAGFERLLAAAPATLRPALQRLYDLTLDPPQSLRHRFDPQVLSDSLSVARFASRVCNLV